MVEDFVRNNIIISNRLSGYSENQKHQNLIQKENGRRKNSS